MTKPRRISGGTDTLTRRAPCGFALAAPKLECVDAGILPQVFGAQ